MGASGRKFAVFMPEDNQIKIAENTVVAIDYTLRSDEGEIIDSSQGREPLNYLHGHGNIISGLENALLGKVAGDSLQVRIEPKEAYGEREDSLVASVDRAQFEGAGEVQAGMRFRAQTESGPRVFTVTAVEGDKVTVDGNHALAGAYLNFDVKVVSVRQASREEIEHGHVHGPGGHHH